MLRIKRVPTIVSNYQKEEADETARPVGGCGRHCLRDCCIQGIRQNSCELVYSHIFLCCLCGELL